MSTTTDNTNTDHTKVTLPKTTVLHPLVLLSIVDHYNRVAKDTNKRVCGVLLGQRNVQTGVVNIASSFAIPFEEDSSNSDSWFFDHNYLENFMTLHRKVTLSEKIVGWYSSSPILCNNDIDIHEVVRRYCEEPVFLSVNVKDHGDVADAALADNTNKYSAPAKAFCSIPLSQDDVQQQSNKTTKKEDGTPVRQAKRQFAHINVEIGSDEAEEVGIEHVLRGISQQHHVVSKSATKTPTLDDLLTTKLSALYGFQSKMNNIMLYIQDVIDGKLPYNVMIINRVQDIVSLIPVLSDKILVETLNEYTNDNMVVVYIASIIRTITSLHDLIKNKDVYIAALRDESVKAAFVQSTKTNNNTNDKKDVTATEDFDIDSVARDRGDENK